MKHSMKYAAMAALTAMCLSCTTKQPNPLAKEILNNPDLQVVDSMGRFILSQGFNAGSGYYRFYAG
jgi:hypothetical protein